MTKAGGMLFYRVAIAYSLMKLEDLSERVELMRDVLMSTEWQKYMTKFYFNQKVWRSRLLISPVISAGCKRSLFTTSHIFHSQIHRKQTNWHSPLSYLLPPFWLPFWDHNHYHFHPLDVLLLHHHHWEQKRRRALFYLSFNPNYKYASG